LLLVHLLLSVRVLLGVRVRRRLTVLARWWWLAVLRVGVGLLLCRYESTLLGRIRGSVLLRRWWGTILRRWRSVLLLGWWGTILFRRSTVLRLGRRSTLRRLLTSRRSPRVTTVGRAATRGCLLRFRWRRFGIILLTTNTTL
jgi:hypothetical protein